nr:gag-pro-pol polyprotein [Bovine leukemia virus]
MGNSPSYNPPAGISPSDWLNLLQSAQRLNPRPSPSDFTDLKNYIHWFHKTQKKPWTFTSGGPTSCPPGRFGRVPLVLATLNEVLSNDGGAPGASAPEEQPPPYDPPAVLPIISEGNRNRHRAWALRELQDIKKEIENKAPGSQVWIQTLRLAILQADPTPADLEQLCQYIASPVDQTAHMTSLTAAIAAAEAANTLQGFNPQNGTLTQQSAQPNAGDLRSQYQNLWLQAWKNLPTRPSVQPWSTIVQGPAESYVEFVNRLQISLADNLPDGVPKEPIIDSLSYANANKECQQILQGRGLVAAPVGQKLQACAHWAPKMKQPAILVHTPGPKMPGPRQPASKRPPPGPCYRCLKEGHWARDCPTKATGPPPGPCPICKDPSHWKRDCPTLKSKKLIEGGLSAPQTITPITDSLSEAELECLLSIPLARSRPSVAVYLSGPWLQPSQNQALMLVDTGAENTVLPQNWLVRDYPRIPAAVLGAGGVSRNRYNWLQGPLTLALKPEGPFITIPKILVDTFDKWQILGRDVLSRLQASISIPEEVPPPVVGVLDAPPSHIGLEHLPPPPEVPQFPLNLERLQALQDLVHRSLEAGYISPWDGPGNNPVFPVRKPNGAWRFVHDLRATNALTKPIPALSPGPPDLTAIPTHLPHIICLDLKDAFFQIPVEDRFRSYFAFTLLTPGGLQPHRRFAWRVLPQGFINSPALFERALQEPLRQVSAAFSQSLLVSYMDDILIASPTEEQRSQCYQALAARLRDLGFQVASEKTRQTPSPVPFLGQMVHEQIVTYQSLPTLQISSPISLHQLQAVLGDLQWVSRGTPTTRRPLQLLYSSLKGIDDPRAIIQLSPEQLQGIAELRQALSHNARSRYNEQEPLLAYVHLTRAGSTLVLFQKGAQFPLAYFQTPLTDNQASPWGLLLLLGCQYLQTQALSSYAKPILKYYHNLPKTSLDNWIQSSEDPRVQELLQLWPQISSQGIQPPGPWKTLITRAEVFLTPQFSPDPIPAALCLFSDGATGRGAYCLWKDHLLDFQAVPAPESAQKGELAGLLAGLAAAPPEPVNIWVDSKYLYSLLRTLVLGAWLQPDPVPSYALLYKSLLRHPAIFVGHVRSHSSASHPIASLNNYVDQLLPLETPEQWHKLTHCNPRALSRWPNPRISAWDPRSPATLCETCQKLNPTGGGKMRTIQRGWAPNHIWQADITHYKYKQFTYALHVFVDTYSGATHASAKRGLTTQMTIEGLLEAIVHLGRPKKLNTDQGANYTSKTFVRFCQQFGVSLSHHVPYNPTSSGLVERTNGLLKLLLSKYHLDEPHLPMTQALSRALWTHNQINLLPILKTRWELHHSPPLAVISEGGETPKGSDKLFLYKLPGQNNRRWLGPLPALVEASGGALLATDPPVWVPWRLLKAFKCLKNDGPEDAHNRSSDG